MTATKLATKPDTDYVAYCLRRLDADPSVSTQELYDEIRAMGYAPSLSTLHRQLRPLRPEPAIPAGHAEAIAAVAKATARRSAAEAAAEAAVTEQVRAIRAAVELGVLPNELSPAAGLSRNRIYQIRDGRRV